MKLDPDTKFLLVSCSIILGVILILFTFGFFKKLSSDYTTRYCLSQCSDSAIECSIACGINERKDVEEEEPYTKERKEEFDRKATVIERALKFGSPITITKGNETTEVNIPAILWIPLCFLAFSFRPFSR